MTEAVLCSEVPHNRCGGGCAGRQGGSAMAGGSSTPGDAVEEILPQGTTVGRGCKQHTAVVQCCHFFPALEVLKGSPRTTLEVV